MLHDLEISGPVMLVLNAVGPARNGICRDDIKLTTGLGSDSLYPILIQLERAGWLPASGTGRAEVALGACFAGSASSSYARQLFC